jgi:putative intracellular protease/amidase
MSNVLEGKRIAILATDGVERRELEEPVEGRTLTSYPSLRTDLRNAGAHPVDEEVAVDGNLISSRSPDDLPAFCRAIVGRFGSG